MHDERDEHGDQEDAQNIFEIVAEQVQVHNDYEEEEALQVFESYRDIKKKIQDKKVGRGFKGSGKGASRGQMGGTWHLQGSIRGKIDMIKAKTRCHICKQVGHWRRECPQRNNARAKSSAIPSTTGSSVTSDVNYTDYLSFDEFWREETIPEVLAVEDESVAEEGRRGGNKKEKNKMMDEWQMREEGKLCW